MMCGEEKDFGNIFEMSDSDGKQSSAATTTTDTSPSSNDDLKLGSSDNGENVKVENGTFFFLSFSRGLA